MFDFNFFSFSSKDSKPESFLIGVAFTSDSMVKGDNGLKSYRSVHGQLFDKVNGGRFLLIEQVAEQVVVRTDPMGQDTIFLYQDDDVWIVSNSLLKVSEKLSSLGINPQPDYSAMAIYRTGQLGLNGGQIISPATPIAGVRLLQADEYIRIDYSLIQPRLEVHQINTPQPNVLSYNEALMAYLTTSLSRTCVLLKGDNANISLSGGIDSRACLAFLTCGAIDKKKVNIVTNKSDLEELPIAQKLAEVTGVGISPSGKTKKINIKDHRLAVRLALLGSAGVYASLVPVANITLKPLTKVHGGSVIGAGYMRSTFREKTNKLKKKYGEDGERVSFELERALTFLGVSVGDPMALFHHYRSYRARLHYGRSSATSLVSEYYMPLIDMGLVAACNASTKKYIEGNGVTRDIISVLNSSLLNVRFDQTNKVKVALKKLPQLDLKNIPELKVYSGNECRREVDCSKSSTTCDKPFHFSTVIADNSLFLRQLGFNQHYIESALQEVDNGNQKLKKSAVLIGLIALLKKNELGISED